MLHLCHQIIVSFYHWPPISASVYEELDLDKASRLDPVPDLLLDGVGDVVDD